jgi:hypothetical protein
VRSVSSSSRNARSAFQLALAGARDCHSQFVLSPTKCSPCSITDTWSAARSPTLKRCGGYAQKACPGGMVPDAHEPHWLSQAGLDKAQARPRLPALPRVTMEEMQSKPGLLAGDTPFVLTDAMRGWRSMLDWVDKDFFPPLLPCSLGQDIGCSAALFDAAEHFYDGSESSAPVSTVSD